MWSNTISIPDWGLVFGAGLSTLGVLHLIFPRLFVRDCEDNVGLPFWLDQLWLHRTQRRVRMAGVLQCAVGLAVLALRS